MIKPSKQPSNNTKDVTLERPLPHNLEAERAVLGAILLDSSLCNQAIEMLKVDDFFFDSHRRIYEKMLILSETAQAIDQITLQEELSRTSELEQIGGVAYLASLYDGAIRMGNIESYAKIIKGKSILRRLITASNQIIHTCMDQESDPYEILDEAEKMVFEIADERIRTGFVSISEVARQQLELVEKASHRPELMTGVPTGFTHLDRLTNGLQRSDLIIIAARPSVGKTAFGLSIAQNASVAADKIIGVFSLEMTKEALVSRLLCSEAQVDAHKLRGGFLSREEWARLGAGLQTISQAKIFIDDTAGISILEMRAKARRLKAEHGLDLLIVDYLQLIRGRGKIENRQQEVSQISRDLKALAKELDVPLIALSQLSRAPESRSDHRPQLADLRESGCLSGETLVYLPEQGQYCLIKDLVGKTGFKVLALNTNTWQLEPSIVTNAFTTGYKPVYTLTTKLGRNIRATANHKFLTINGWKRLDRLILSDRIALPQQLPETDKSTLTNAELALLGHLIGDGCTLPRHSIQYTTKDLRLAELVANLAKEVFRDKITPRIKQERSWYQVYLPASEKLTHKKRNPITEWLDKLEVFGLRSYEKRIPKEVFTQSTQSISCFLRHLWVTDGCIKHYPENTHYPSIYYASSSIELVFGVQSLLLRLGINARISSHGQKNKGRIQYHITISGKPDIEKFLNEIGSVSSDIVLHLNAISEQLAYKFSNTNRDIIPAEVWRGLALPAAANKGWSHRDFQKFLGMSYCGTSLYKQNLSRERATSIAKLVKSDELLALGESHVYWDEIVSIEPDGISDVYDLTVDKLHNFVANGIVAHNSIEQDADVVMFIYREEIYNQTEENQGQADIIIGKQRNGPIDTVKLAFIKQFTRFENLYT
ncbi:MAG: replicative DNA helicase [Acidobacteria bacterium]|nr:replicative DNA helicase [Acidobacteriota bacterium]